jgi:HAMP domain-containing protein
MKIRTRLFLFFLPPLVATNIALGAFLTYWSYKEAFDNHVRRVQASLQNIAREYPLSSLPEAKMKQIENRHKDLSFLSVTSSLPKDMTDRIGTDFWTVQKESSLITVLKIGDDPQLYLVANSSLVPLQIMLQKYVILALSLVILMITGSCFLLFILANKIANPVKKLTKCALAIAAGDYGNKVDVKGPKEISDLSNTLNTLSECLLENINHLKENALYKEKMYGEHESALLFQHKMLNKVIESCSSDLVAMQSISFFSHTPQGVLLEFPKSELFTLQLTEAKKAGFEGMYELLTHHKLAKSKKPNYPFISLSLDTEKALCKINRSHTPKPIFWSRSSKQLQSIDKDIPFAMGDFIFVYNQGLYHYCPLLDQVIHNICKIFSEEGIEAITHALRKELRFRLNRKESDQDLHLICLQILGF